MKKEGARLALITGASGDIGFAVAKSLLENGYDIIAHYNTASGRNDGLSKIAIEVGREVTFLKADFTNQKSLSTFIKKITSKEKLGTRKLHTVIHCAGLNEKKQFLDVTEKDFDRIFAINTKSPLFITQALIKKKSFVKGASVLFIGTPNSYVGGSSRNTLYTGSKTTLLGWHKNLAKALAPELRVNSVVPGYIDTKMLREKNNESALEKKRSTIPAARFGETKEIADIIIFLISDQAKYITGQAIHVNGGLFLS